MLLEFRSHRGVSCGRPLTAAVVRSAGLSLALSVTSRSDAAEVPAACLRARRTKLSLVGEERAAASSVSSSAWCGAVHEVDILGRLVIVAAVVIACCVLLFPRLFGTVRGRWPPGGSGMLSTLASESAALSMLSSLSLGQWAHLFLSRCLIMCKGCGMSFWRRPWRWCRNATSVCSAACDAGIAPNPMFADLNWRSVLFFGV